ncbi:MAG: hypothetical protein R3B99_31870 [Polyangiales bacterium]
MTTWSKKPDGAPAPGALDAPAAAPATPPAAPPAAAVPAPEPPSPPKGPPVMPEGWGGAKPIKAWSEGRRADNPDKRWVLPPLASGIGDGRVFSFLFGLKIHSPNDRMLFAKAREHIDDDVEVLRQAGFTVVVDEEAVREDFLGAIQGNAPDAPGLAPAGVFWLAHGHEDGAVETCDGGKVAPSEVDPASVHPGLKLMVFAACYTGATSRTWRKALGGRPLVVGWGRPVTIDRAVDFLTADEATENDLDDLIRRYLLGDAPVPAEVEVRHSPLAPAAGVGRSADLSSRLDGVVAMLSARITPSRDPAHCVEMDVPLGQEAQGRKRWHKAKIFVLDGMEAYCEGELLLGVECDVGELSNVVDLPMLLAGIDRNRYARVSLVSSDKEMPRIVTQGFLPLARVRDADIAALVYQVSDYADLLEKRIFGGDMG